mmetsp:Transcript_9362/g.25437  ORF Transcript_9362/g.25437 Transcript_9362/m.25437 type:complete len:129 (+) Transcript_9362:884-1270(+)
MGMGGSKKRPHHSGVEGKLRAGQHKKERTKIERKRGEGKQQTNTIRPAFFDTPSSLLPSARHLAPSTFHLSPTTYHLPVHLCIGTLSCAFELMLISKKETGLLSSGCQQFHIHSCVPVSPSPSYLVIV